MPLLLSDLAHFSDLRPSQPLSPLNGHGATCIQETSPYSPSPLQIKSYKTSHRWGAHCYFSLYCQNRTWKLWTPRNDLNKSKLERGVQMCSEHFFSPSTKFIVSKSGWKIHRYILAGTSVSCENRWVSWFLRRHLWVLCLKEWGDGRVHKFCRLPLLPWCRTPRIRSLAGGSAPSPRLRHLYFRLECVEGYVARGTRSRKC